LTGHRETFAFGLVLAGCLGLWFHESLVGRRVLSPADVLLVQASFGGSREAAGYEPLNRLLMDPVLQFQPWLEFNRAELRRGRLPLWNPHAGCGAPHLANGQSAVFDPFNLVACLGPIPKMLAWIAAGRLWVAGLGAFVLARTWGLGGWGRWFAGLVFPFCGFLMVWLLYPVTPVAIWLPWLLLACDRLLEAPSVRRVGLLAVVVGLVIVGGHIQTSAHLLMASGFLVAWRIWRSPKSWSSRLRGLSAWSLGTALGVMLGAIQILPLAGYLTRSPVWLDRLEERPVWWRFDRPRWLEAACTALPYVYGSQRRGHPNAARALGVHNLNESAGGYAGLVTLVWLAPLGLGGRRRVPEVAWLAALTIIGALGAFRLPPVDNLLRALPVLNVMDHRRLTLWVAFGLTMLGAMGLDRLAQGHLPRSQWIVCWLAAAATLGGVAAAIPALEPKLRERALRQAADQAVGQPELSPTPAGCPEPSPAWGCTGQSLTTGRLEPSPTSAERAERHVRAAVTFLPRYYGLAAAELIGIAALAGCGHARRRRGGFVLPLAVLGLTLGELAVFGIGLNPAIDPAIQSLTPPLIQRLRQGLRPDQRALGIGAELPPNVLMRFGLSDPRNYDSVELARSLDWFAPLYGPGSAARTSRREIGWSSVLQGMDRLVEACVGAVVSASPPPSAQFAAVEAINGVWIAWIDTPPWATAGPSSRIEVQRGPDWAFIRVETRGPETLVVRETWDPGWKAWLDGEPVRIELASKTFWAIDLPPGRHHLRFRYQPVEVAVGLAISAVTLAVVILALTGIAPYRIPGITNRGLGGSRFPTLESKPVSSTGASVPAHHPEGRIADGPLHV
jgi:hypothetical protein